MEKTKMTKRIVGIVLGCLIVGSVVGNLQHVVLAQESTSYDFEYPNTIKILRTATGDIDEVDFEEYVRNVLPNEWIASWDIDALKAGAVAVRTYAWYWTIHQKYPGQGYDVRDDTWDQVYIPGSAQPRTDQAIAETWNWIMMRNGEVFQAQYDSGTPGSSDPLHPGRMSQWGTQYWADRGKDWRWILHYYYDPMGLGGVELGWPAGEANICRYPWDGFIDFEDGTDEAVIRSSIPGLEFTTTLGLDWIYGDIRTGKYNVYPYGHQGYETNGNFFAWLGVTGDQGRIDFPSGTATYLSVLASTSSGLTIDAYDADGNLLVTSGWAENNLHTRSFTRLTVEAQGMAYVIIHDWGNYWLIDDLCTDAPGVPSPHYEAAELAKAVVGAPYAWGAKGWSIDEREFLDASQIKIENYRYYYWDGDEKKTKVGYGPGLDCSGLIFWAYNEAYDAIKYREPSNPVYYEGADGQYRNDFTVEVIEDELLPGDLLFFDWDNDGYMNHVGMYVGPNGDGNDVVHASSASGKIVWAKKEDLTNLEGFAGFRRLEEPRVDIEFKSHSPVDLVVTDPDGIEITRDIYEIPGIFYYYEWDMNGDGEIDDMVVVPERKTGDYLIAVVPQPDASPADTYSLEVTAGDQTIILAENVPISDIPSGGYIVRSTETGIMQIIPATIDFDPDNLNLKSKGKVVTVYIELPESYDVGDIDGSTVRLNYTVPAFTHPTSVSDYDTDGVPDLMVKFNRFDVVDILEFGEEIVVTIAGEVAGITFEGSDTIRVIDE